MSINDMIDYADQDDHDLTDPKDHDLEDTKDHSEESYSEFYELAQELGYPVPAMYLETESLDADGNSISNSKMRAHSWTRNAYNFLVGQLGSCLLNQTPWGEGYLNIINTAGSLFGTSYTTGISTIYGVVADSSYGIQVGASGITYALPTFNDYKLGLPIIHGNPGVANVLSYSAGVNVSQTWVTNELYRRSHKRYFNNNSGNSINIEEIGIVYRLYKHNGYYSTLLCRDVLAAPEVVVDGGQYIVTYTHEMVYPPGSG